jgi:hypothetical protein
MRKSRYTEDQIAFALRQASGEIVSPVAAADTVNEEAPDDPGTPCCAERIAQ